ncbi:uncharacterized protein LDX57_008314 [Aspergillus melleus]|uniref:uncharacterized protein n=1 Tax=Aspergillus melleus TaxID=138277 RepID=UPI001E8E1218|nr:uncharacterized protein LDX57_008314 [Aspergillus melleus]KAH8430651.1 hypothetical protein LDX57_008314 [Aspergillus melleus]
MTKCTDKQCTSHFGIICTHHQWLTQLSCLSTEFSPDVIQSYFAYCHRSILAKAQLYQWIRTITGRTWLVDIGDSNGLQILSPASLAEGYAAVDVIDKAPKCLTDSISASSMEPFQHVVASCGFTGTTRDTGNAARPWEYSESLRSMIALDFETAGYDLISNQIRDGDYFDRDCFCSTFTMDFKNEPCSESGELDLTKERLWMNATCGSTSLPDNWRHALKTTQFAYIPIDNWNWPKCVADIPKEVIQLTDQCATDACDLDSSGYCKVRRAVDRACFCRNISYNSCGGSCQIFETRIDYIKWLRGLCDNLQDWNGLPANWRQLAAPTASEMIPWEWTLMPSIDSEACASSEWKLGSFALVNIATLLAAFLSQITSRHRNARGSSWQSHPWHWFSKGVLIAGLHLLTNWFNSLIIQSSSGYENTPVIQLTLLWCSMPRLAWLIMPLNGLQPIEETRLSAFASLLLAEGALQLASSYDMLMTVDYGRQHNFYFGGLEGADRADQAKVMYAGALMWLVVVIMTLVQFMRAMRNLNRPSMSDHLRPTRWQRYEHATTNATTNEAYRTSRENQTYHWAQNDINAQNTPLTSPERGDYRTYGTIYGTFSVKGRHHVVFQNPIQGLYASAVMNMFLFWVAQWLFWAGLIGLMADEFCPPKHGILTAVWIVSSFVGTVVSII